MSKPDHMLEHPTMVDLDEATSKLPGKLVSNFTLMLE